LVEPSNPVNPAHDTLKRSKRKTSDNSSAPRHAVFKCLETSDKAGREQQRTSQGQREGKVGSRHTVRNNASRKVVQKHLSNVEREK
jgi:hypothetical protein